MKENKRKKKTKKMRTRKKVMRKKKNSPSHQSSKARLQLHRDA